MCLNKFNRTINKIIDANNKFIFRMLSKIDKNFNHCYICNKEINNNHFSLLTFPTEEITLCLCGKCTKKFKKQMKLHKKIFMGGFDDKLEEDIRNNRVAIPEVFKSKLIQLSFANKLWLDQQRRLYAERRNKNKD